jgi:transposase
MKAVVLAEMLRETLEAKINKIRREILHDTHVPIEVERMEAQIMAYQWVQARIQDIVINNHGEDKDTKIRI